MLRITLGLYDCRNHSTPYPHLVQFPVLPLLIEMLFHVFDQDCEMVKAIK